MESPPTQGGVAGEGMEGGDKCGVLKLMSMAPHAVLAWAVITC